MIKAHKIRLLPNNKHLAYFSKACGVARFSWNWALTQRERQFKARNPEIVDDYGTRVGFGKCRPVDNFGNEVLEKNGIALKKEFSSEIDRRWPWMRETTSYAYQRVFSEIDDAYKRFFKGLSEKPRCKKKGQSHDSFYLANTCISVQGRHVKIQKLGVVRMRNELRFQGKIMSARISRDADQWFISIAVEVQDTSHPHKQAHVGVGVDMGVALIAALSTGETFTNPLAVETHERKLKGLQRKLSRQMQQACLRKGLNPTKPTPRGVKIESSKRMLKTKRRIARAHRDITGLRSNAQHQATAEISKRFGLIVIEDLRVKDMTAGATEKQKRKRRAKTPSWHLPKTKTGAVHRRVAQKKGLNRSILNVGFGEIRRQLEYKARWAGAAVIPVNPAYTSQTCSCCGSVSAENRQSQARFVCVACGHTANADINAAKNILSLGRARQTEGMTAKEVKRVGRLTPTRRKNSDSSESTADAAGYAQGGSSFQSRPMNCEHGAEKLDKAMSGGVKPLIPVVCERRASGSG
jgi:putative transposase